MLVLRLKKRKLVRKNKFIISGGGTGGHIYPAISIANMIMKSIPNSEVRFVGAIGKMEMKIIPKHGFKIKGLWISGFQRSFSFKNLVFPLKIIYSLIKSFLLICMSMFFKIDLLCLKTLTFEAEIKALREIVVANEHDNSELAFESYEKDMSLVN